MQNLISEWQSYWILQYGNPCQGYCQTDIRITLVEVKNPRNMFLFVTV